MKKLAYFTVLVAALGLIALGCQKSQNPVVPEPLEHSGINSLTKGNPNLTKPFFEYFKIDGHVLIENNVVCGRDFPIDFSAVPCHTIEYKVTHPADIEYVQVSVYYDMNVDYDRYPEWTAEFGADVFWHYYDGHKDKTAEGTFIWDGKVTPDYWDDFYSGPYYLFDQLATYNDDGAPLPGADHYGILIRAQASGSQANRAYKETHVWIQATGKRDGTLKVQDVSLSLPKKGKFLIPTATVTVVNEANEPLKDCYVYGVWGGIIASDVSYKGGPSGEDGKVTIKGPKIEKDAVGLVKFTVKSARKELWVYNPWAHDSSRWPWPDVEPYAEETLPVVP